MANLLISYKLELTTTTDASKAYITWNLNAEAPAVSSDLMDSHRLWLDGIPLGMQDYMHTSVAFGEVLGTIQQGPGAGTTFSYLPGHAFFFGTNTNDPLWFAQSLVIQRHTPGTPPDMRGHFFMGGLTKEAWVTPGNQNHARIDFAYWHTLLTTFGRIVLFGSAQCKEAMYRPGGGIIYDVAGRAVIQNWRLRQGREDPPPRHIGRARSPWLRFLPP